MFYYQSVERSTLELLKYLMGIKELRQLRLAGGTSLALQIGHRRSIDLDLFGKNSIDDFDLIQLLKGFGKVQQLQDSKNIKIFTVEGIKVDIVNYPYPFIEEPIVENGIRLAGKSDIGAMKLAAIAGRGTRKDFIDIFFLLKEFDLKTLIMYYSLKFKEGSPFLVLKSLTYFEDAEKDEFPDMLININWEEVKATILNSHKTYIESL